MASQTRPVEDHKPPEVVADPNLRSKEEEQSDRLVTLRILVRRHHGYWYALCLDLNLMTRRNDISSAVTALNEQITVYLESAREAGEWGARVPRRAPLWDWLLYYGCTALDIARSFASQTMACTTFRVPFDRHGHLVGA